jgi:acetyl-CoA carboxylase carboxyltransferase component
MSTDPGGDGGWPALLEEQRRREEQADAGGGRARQARQHRLARLNARERIAALVDAGSFGELGRHVLHRHDGDESAGLAAHRHPGDGLVCGFAAVDGRPVAVYAHDPTVLRGALGRAGAEKLCRLLDLAGERRVPVVTLADSDGARVAEVVDAIEGYGAVIARTIRLRRQVPQITLVSGLCVGGAAYTAVLGDLVAMVDGQSFLFLTGDKVTRVVTGAETPIEDLGGPALHAGKTGACHAVVPDEAAGIAWVRRLLGYLAPSVAAVAAAVDGGDLADVIPVEPRKVYDVRRVLDAVFDAGSICELAAAFAPNLVTALARLAGRAVAVVASQPQSLGGCLDAAASRKGADFLAFADKIRAPVITLVDVPGYLPGRKQEEEGVLPYGARLLVAYGELRVPRVCLVLRKSYGGGNVLSYNADVRLALPTARVAPMGVDAALEVALGPEPEDMTDAQRSERATRRDGWLRRHDHGWAAAGAGYVDRVVAPADARRELRLAVENLDGVRGGAGR